MESVSISRGIANQIKIDLISVDPPKSVMMMMEFDTAIQQSIVLIKKSIESILDLFT